MTTPASHARGLHTAEEIAQAAREAEHALPPLTQQQAARIAAAFAPALAELRRREQEHERNGAA